MTARFDRQLIPARPDLSFEQALWKEGLLLVGGIDEAGRGAWAGPVSAGVVVLPPDSGVLTWLAGVRDSKQMTASQRAYWAVEIKSAAAAWGVGMASHQELDAIGIVGATRLAVARSLATLDRLPQHLLVDYLDLPDISLAQTALVKGDARSLSIACASVLAKTSRDVLLTELDEHYPGYGFAGHKGYGTAFHRSALERLSFKPLQTAGK